MVALELLVGDIEVSSLETGYTEGIDPNLLDETAGGSQSIAEPVCGGHAICTLGIVTPIVISAEIRRCDISKGALLKASNAKIVCSDLLRYASSLIVIRAVTVNGGRAVR
jgi:hypothetical protein